MAAFAAMTGIVATLVILVSLHDLAGTPSSARPSPAASAMAIGPTRAPATAPATTPAPSAAAGSVSPPSTAPPPGGVAFGGGIGRFGQGLLIADRGNGRLLIVNDAHQVLWQFPVAGSLPPHQRFSADDAFVSPDGQTIVANDEAHQVIDRIDIATRRIVWQFGSYDHPGHGAGQLHTPDDAYPLANGDIVVADIRNCRILEIAPSKAIVRQWGRTGSCRDRPPTSFDNPNGDTPLPDGGLLITEIGGSRVVRLAPNGRVVFDIHVPVAYPSDAQLDPAGNVIVVDYSNPGAILRVAPNGRVLWRYRPSSGPGRLDHPSLAVPLPDGTIALNDDFRHRVIVVDPTTNRIVWQYGSTDAPGRGGGRLFIPDGINPVPVGVHL